MSHDCIPDIFSSFCSPHDYRLKHRKKMSTILLSSSQMSGPIANDLAPFRAPVESARRYNPNLSPHTWKTSQ